MKTDENWLSWDINQKKEIKNLIGKTVKAFGKPKGFWGKNKKSINYVISKISFKKIDKDLQLFDVEIYLENYNSATHGFIYTDPTFLKSINSYLTNVKLDYTEQGAQGYDYISMEMVPKNYLNTI